MQLSLVEASRPVSVEVLSEVIRLRFGDNCLLFNVEEDRIYFNGEKLKTTEHEFHYNKSLMFERNKVIPKKRLLTLGFDGFVFGLDVGFDGRLFGKLWAKQKYVEERGEPFWVCSYWHDRRAKEVKWYERDLKNPKRMWKKWE